MEFNPDKCDVIDRTYKGSGRSVDILRDLGVLVHYSLISVTQVDRIVKKALLGQGIEYKN